MRHEILNEHAAKPAGRALSGQFSLVTTFRRYPETNRLPIGAQARLVQAAVFSVRQGTPINTLLTINAAHLQRMGAGGVFALGHLWDGFRDFRQLARKWVTARGVTWTVIWAREYAGGKHGQAGEHWHIALHLPKHLRADFAAQVAVWTDEDIGDREGPHTIARSVGKAWHFRSSAPKGYGPSGLAEYLGKAEPSWVRHYGRTVPNKDKPNRWRNGGHGPIQGQRFGVSRPIGTKAQAAAAA